MSVQELLEKVDPGTWVLLILGIAFLFLYFRIFIPGRHTTMAYIRYTLTEKGQNNTAIYAFDQIKALANGETYLRNLFLGVDTGGMKYNTPEKFVGLWVSSGRTAGGVLYSMQWQPKATGPNGGQT